MSDEKNEEKIEFKLPDLVNEATQEKDLSVPLKLEIKKKDRIKLFVLWELGMIFLALFLYFSPFQQGSILCYYVLIAGIPFGFAFFKFKYVGVNKKK